MSTTPERFPLESQSMDIRPKGTQMLIIGLHGRLFSPLGGQSHSVCFSLGFVTWMR